MKIKIDRDSYKSSPIFNYIIDDLLLVKKTYTESISNLLDLIQSKDKLYDYQRSKLVGEHIEGDLLDIYLDQLSNNHLRSFLLNGALMYYYSQIEIKLYEICERLPILVNCEPINNFKSKKSGKIDKVADYISKFASVEIKSIDNWLKISDFSKIRNSITHSETISEKKRLEYKSIADRNKGKVLFKPQSSTLEIELLYLSDIINISFDFIEKIITKIWETHHS